MFVVRSVDTGWVNSWGSPRSSSYELLVEELTVIDGPLVFRLTAAVASVGLPPGYEMVSLSRSATEFEAAAREDAGIGPDEPLGEMYLTDEPEVSATAKPDKPGKRIGKKRLKAYPPDTTTVAERLAEELGAKGGHNVTWAALAEYERRLNA